ncbi:MAG: prepilin-type N-terminal cleavage/methylation domain-containing protein [Gammaproteobacteria bacterium]
MSVQNKQKGVGLLELMLSLAVIAVILVVVGRYFTSVSFSQKANTIHAQFIDISQALFRYRELKGSWTGVTLNELKPWLNKEFANNIDPNSGTAPGPLTGTSYQVVPQVNNITKQESVSIEISGFNSDPNDLNSDCAKLANRMNGVVCDGKTLKYCYPASACQ